MVYENGTLKPDQDELAILEQWAIELDDIEHTMAMLH